MIHKAILTDIPIAQFLSELEMLLKKSGISTSRRQIQAEINPKESRGFPSAEEYSPQVGRIIVYLEAHFTEELSLDELAEKVELSKYQLIRRFREEEGTTPWKYIIQQRVEKAKQLLEQGVSPGQVAAETGFYDQSHFSKSFREETGQTPKEYQEENFINRN
ncbi:MAG TPA: AraC family transcriptional regulator [Balneolaceae bacterium]|nr:AraC family transcriptional regulator [Balneolaceae bacterium]